MDFCKYTLLQLETGAENLEKTICSKLGDVDLSFSREIESQRKLVLCRSKEWTSRAFFIIVVGPVKSGKSTFVNLLAHAHVSPTHFLECTVRPSIITKAKNPLECRITSYNYECNTTPSIEVVDSVIDSIKGLDFASMNDVTVESPCALNEKNLDQKVARDIDFLQTDKQKTILTSITAPGGDFLTEDVYLIDMPGFDGIVSNIELPFYEAIINRTDLVVFIQSSNSAISKISEDFFNILKGRNGSVPMLFIHNNYDSSFWHPMADRIRKIAEQVSEARTFFAAKYHQIPEDDCKTINLGKVNDYRSGADFPEFNSDLKSENDLFTQIEKELHERIHSSQGTVRLSNCLNRTLCELDRLITLVEENLKEKKKTNEEYGTVASIFTAFKNRIKPPVGPDILKTIDLTPNGVVAALSGIKNQLISTLGLSSNYTYQTVMVRGYAQNLINNYILAFDSFVSSKIDKQAISAFIRSSFESAVNDAKDEDFQNLLSRYGRYVSIPAIVPDDVVFDYSSINNIYDVDKNIPKKKLAFKYSYDEIITCLNAIDVAYLGPGNEGRRIGYIQVTVLQNITDKISEWVDGVINCYGDALSAEIESIEQSIHHQIVADPDALDSQIKLLEETLIKLKDISISKSV